MNAMATLHLARIPLLSNNDGHPVYIASCFCDVITLWNHRLIITQVILETQHPITDCNVATQQYFPTVD